MPVISTNLAANSAVRYLNMNSAAQTSSLSKLASGSRITQASDDAAGLAISTKISSDVTALAQAATNASHGISVLQTADGGASNISDILQRMKALASQSASGTVGNTERAYIDAEFKQLVDEIDAIAVGTRYNGSSLLSGNAASGNDFAGTGIDVMVGSSATDVITVKLATLDTAALGLKSQFTEAGTGAAAAAQLLTGATVTAGNDISFSVNGTKVTLTSIGGTAGVYTATQVTDAIQAALTADGNTTVTGAAGTLTNAGIATTDILSIVDLSGNTFGASGILATPTATSASTDTRATAVTAIGVIDAAINTVSAARASIGSLESRFGFHQASIATSIENLTSAVSAIKDTDVASEAAKLASAKVKTQAAVAAAAQASQMPQELLKLMQ